MRMYVYVCVHVFGGRIFNVNISILICVVHLLDNIVGYVQK